MITKRKLKNLSHEGKRKKESKKRKGGKEKEKKGLLTKFIFALNVIIMINKLFLIF